MRWHCPSVPRPIRRIKGPRIGLFGLPVFGKPVRTSKSQRVNQEDEVYINLFYPTRISKTAQDRIASQNIKGPAINVIRAVARELYEKEDEGTRAVVKAKLASLKQEEMTEEVSDDEAEGEDAPLTPQQYQA